jgi:hypothetical protein
VSRARCVSGRGKMHQHHAIFALDASVRVGASGISVSTFKFRLSTKYSSLSRAGIILMMRYPSLRTIAESRGL